MVVMEMRCRNEVLVASATSQKVGHARMLHDERLSEFGAASGLFHRFVDRSRSHFLFCHIVLFEIDEICRVKYHRIL